jgi:di/tricarboxylate transporter
LKRQTWVRPFLYSRGGLTDSKVIIALEEKLQANDIIWWSGHGIAIGNLRKILGLSPFEKKQLKKLGGASERRLVQAVIARTGPLVGKTIKDLKFRTRFNCAVIAVNREGVRLHQHIGGIALQGGDVLLLEAGPNFLKENAENTRCFALLSEIKDSTPPRMKMLIPSLLLVAAMLTVFMLEQLSLLMAALCTAMAMVMCGILTQAEARNAVNWEVYITIACAFGIGTAMVNSGVAGGMAQFLVKLGVNLGLGNTGVFAMVYLSTVLISSVVTNNAAAALIFPVAVDAAERANMSLLNMAFCVMLGASASFVTPFGYQTNLMVFGPGGYKATDFIKFGAPLQVLLWIWATVLLGVGDGGNEGLLYVF